MRRPLLTAVLALLVCAGLLGGDPPSGPVYGQGDDQVALGERLFTADLTLADGLGPLYNGTSCAGCHSAPSVGGMGSEGLGVAIRVGRLVDGRFDPLAGQGGPVARRRTVAELGVPCDLQPGIPPGATITSVRNAPALFGLGLLDGIPDEVILAGAVPRGDGVQGRPHLVVDGPAGARRVGRFGWKADVATLERFVAEAFRNEHGVTSPLAPEDILPAGPIACPGASGAGPEDDGTKVRAVTSFVAALPAPAGHSGADGSLVTRGAAVFRATGCIACHTASLASPQGDVPLYSDLLLHDMGPALDDGVVQGNATGRDWRTTPLWGLGARTRFLHDGRARTVRAAVQAHGGEAATAAARFRDLPAPERDALLAFLGSL